MSGEPKVVFEREEALGTVTLLSPPLNLIGQELIDDLLAAIDQVEAALVGLFDTEHPRGGIKAFLRSGVADAAFAGR